MYCSSCGAAVAHNLIYCNHCGARLTGAKSDGSKASELSPNILIAAMVIVFVIGMAAITAGLTGLKKYGFEEAMIYAFLVSSFLLLLALEGIFIWLLFNRRKVEKEFYDSNRLYERETKELYTAPARELTEPMPSAVEQTTNLLEPIYRDQKSK